jgi:hypothetical protein
MSLTPEDLSTMQLYRDRILAGEQIPPGELFTAIRLLRADRLGAANRATATKSRAKSAKAKVTPQATGDLLAKIGIPGL